MKSKPTEKVLLHICCGVCALYCIDFLKASGYAVTGFFSNPNIEPYDEYKKRKLFARRVCLIKGIELIEDSRDHRQWKLFCAGFEGEKEGGRRCLLCYEFRLRKVYRFMADNAYDFFTTTLTISPHKPVPPILAIGQRYGGERFLSIDFKKKGGFVKTMREAKAKAIYRQNYCGCFFAKNQADLALGPPETLKPEY